MLNFDEELKNYEPLPDLDELNDISADQLTDVLKLVQSMAKKAEK